MIQTMPEQELLEKAKMAEEYGAKIEICGFWAWAKFDSKPCKDVLENIKRLGYKYQKSTKRWYLKGAESARFGKKTMGMDYIRSRYGSMGINDLELAA